MANKKTNGIGLFGWSFIIGGVVALGYLAYREYKKATSFLFLTVSASKNPFQISRIASSMVDAVINVVVTNPTEDTAEAQNVSISVFNDAGKKLGVAELPVFSVSGGAAAEVRIPIQFPVSALGDVATGIANSKKIQVKGTAEYLLAGIPVSVPIDFWIDLRQALVNNLTSLLANV